jgi:hypothetical protein
VSRAKCSGDQKGVLSPPLGRPGGGTCRARLERTACVTFSAPLAGVVSGWLLARDKTGERGTSRVGASPGPGGQDNAGLDASRCAGGATADATTVAPALSAK